MAKFSEKIQTAFDPPPHFRKVTLRFSRQNCDKSAYVHMEALLCIIWSYFPWDACSTNVQHGNWLKTYPKKTLCINFMVKKPCLRVQILQYKFLDWKWPPPFWNFSENSSVLEGEGVPYSSSTLHTCFTNKGSQKFFLQIFGGFLQWGRWPEQQK